MTLTPPFLLNQPLRPDTWTLDPAVTYLNHGSFGACPRSVLECQQQLRLELEHEPVAFLVQKLTPLLDAARRTLAAFVGAVPTNLVFVSNATAGVNSVLRSLRFAPGDEILGTQHDYNACRNVVRYVAQQSGATIVEVRPPVPTTASQQIVDAVLACVTPRTRLAMLDHVTSPTALVFPIETLVHELNRRGVDTLVDAAHAPGMLPLDLESLEAAYCTGNCHKWLCAPKGAGFLYVRPDRQHGIQPPIISHGWNHPRPDHSPFQDGFDWPGTFDPTPWLCVANAIHFLDTLLPGGSAALMARNHALAVQGQQILVERLGLIPLGPESLLGAMAALQFPAAMKRTLTAPTVTSAPDAQAAYIHDALLSRFGIEVPLYFWPDASRLIVRISAQAYNCTADYEKLATTLIAMITEQGGPTMEPC